MATALKTPSSARISKRAKNAAPRLNEWLCPRCVQNLVNDKPDQYDASFLSGTLITKCARCRRFYHDCIAVDILKSYAGGTQG